MLFLFIDMKETKYIGIALDTLLDDDTTDLRVWVSELAPFVDTSPDMEEPLNPTLTNKADGGQQPNQVAIISYITAKYRSTHTNKLRPNIHVGERIEVIEYGDNGEYYWKEIGDDDALRTRERYRILVSAKGNQIDPLTEENGYLVDVDSRKGNKKLRVHTTQADGESVGYDIILDLESGKFAYTDTIGNNIGVESQAQRIWLHNAGGDTIDIAPGKIDVYTTAFTVNAQTITMNCDMFSVSASSNAAFNTNLFSVAAPTSTFSGLVSVASTVSAANVISSVGVNLNTHYHPGDGGAGSGPTTGPPKT